MPLTDPHGFQQKLIQAIKETGNRAIVLIGTSGMAFDPNEHILAVDQAPHRLLFKRAAGIVHHGGVGLLQVFHRLLVGLSGLRAVCQWF